MDYFCQCPDPGDKDGWRQYTICTAIAAVIGIVVCVVIYFLLR
jgi:hypothetical protein